MIVMRIAALSAALGLALAPLSAGARILLVPDCNGGTHMIVVPGDPAAPVRGEDCAKACHAVTDRRGKAAAGKRTCC